MALTKAKALKCFEKFGESKVWFAACLKDASRVKRRPKAATVWPSKSKFFRRRRKSHRRRR